MLLKFIEILINLKKNYLAYSNKFNKIAWIIKCTIIEYIDNIFNILLYFLMFFKIMFDLNLIYNRIISIHLVIFLLSKIYKFL